jgi:hypothetical protein
MPCQAGARSASRVWNQTWAPWVPEAGQAPANLGARAEGPLGAVIAAGAGEATCEERAEEEAAESAVAAATGAEGSGEDLEAGSWEEERKTGAGPPYTAASEGGRDAEGAAGGGDAAGAEGAEGAGDAEAADTGTAVAAAAVASGVACWAAYSGPEAGRCLAEACRRIHWSAVGQEDQQVLAYSGFS